MRNWIRYAFHKLDERENSNTTKHYILCLSNLQIGKIVSLVLPHLKDIIDYNQDSSSSVKHMLVAAYLVGFKWLQIMHITTRCRPAIFTVRFFFICLIAAGYCKIPNII